MRAPIPLILAAAVACQAGSGLDSTAGLDTEPSTTGAASGTSTSAGTTRECGLAFLWTDEDGQPPADTDGDGAWDASCSEDTLTVTICDPLGVTEWDFGMVDIARTWTGEDCPTCSTTTAITR